ncbi:MAG: hypothetical protein NC241_10220 [Bacteroides sp.]|nr:hypothetical protein [Bacteroides sp.]MCM1456920.1 hypothetical protein [Lachnoclostridium sp.]
MNNKFLIFIFCLAAAFGAAHAQEYYLRGPLFYSNGEPWAQGHVDAAYKFVADTETGTLSVAFPEGLNTGNGNADSRNFAISINDINGPAWPNDGTIVLGEHWKGNSSYSDGLPIDERLPVYFGGGRNGVLPANVTIKEIQLKLPTNKGDYADGNNGANYVPDSGAGWINIITKDNVTTIGRSEYGLEVWRFSHTGSTTASWDISGSLMWPILDNNDPGFYDKYHDHIDDVDYIMFRSVASESIIQANQDGTPVENYDPDTQIIQYYPGSNVYVIDFKHDMTNGHGGNDYPTDATEDGLYVTVPNAKAMDDVKGLASYYNVPRILRSGVRFGVYKGTEGLSHKYKYLKYGRTTRLNAKPVEIGFGSWNFWNGIPLDKMPNPSVEDLNNNNDGYHHIKDYKVSGTYQNAYGETVTFTDEPYLNIQEDNFPSEITDKSIGSTFYNKIGDNRLLSEYNMFIERIILEVVNQGNHDDNDNHERVYIRFEGRYDLKAVTTDDVTLSFSDAGMENSTNMRGDEPNIYTGNTIRFFDRGFARFYGCYNPQYHNLSYNDNLPEAKQFPLDLKKYGLLDYTEGYTAKSEYSVLDDNGDVVNYIGYENKYGGDLDKDESGLLDLAMKDYPAIFMVEYKSTNYDDPDFSSDIILGKDDEGNDVYSHFMANKINGNDCTSYSGRHLNYSAKTPEQIKTQLSDPDGQYGNATEMIIQGRSIHLLHNFMSLTDAKRPVKMKAKTTYYFPNTEPNNVPTYTTTNTLKTSDTLNAKVNVTAKPEGYLDDEFGNKGFVSFVDVKGSEYAYGEEWEIGSGQTKAYYPVTRWELSAYDADKGDTTESYVKSSANDNKLLDEDNKFNDEDFWWTLYNDNRGYTDNKTRNITYRAKMIYTLGNVEGTIAKSRASQSTVISGKALRQYVNKTENTANNAYALVYKNGIEVEKNNKKLRQFTLSPKEGISFGEGYTPKDIQVSLYHYPVAGETTVSFENRTTTGIEDVDINIEAPAEYYNLQGVRVVRPVSGSVYIVRRGNVTTKELVY